MEKSKSSNIIANNDGGGDNRSTYSNEKLLTKVQRYQFIDRMLAESFPLVFLLVLSLLNIFIGAVLIGLQTLCIIYRTPLYFIAVGIWFGVFLIFSELIVFLLICRRSCVLFMTSVIFHAITIVLAVLVGIIVGVEILVSFLVYSDTNFIWVNYSILGLGVFSIFPAVFYLLVFKRQFHKFYQVFSIENFYNRN